MMNTDLVTSSQWLLLTLFALALLTLSAWGWYSVWRKRSRSISEAESEQLTKPLHGQSEALGTAAEIEPAAQPLSQALSRTKASWLEKLKGAFVGGQLADEELENLEEVLYTSDLGPKTVGQLLEAVKEKVPRESRGDFGKVQEALKDEMRMILGSVPQGLPLAVGHSLNVWMIVGVNGAGKTTTIGKLAAQLARDGKKVLVAAGDTFRAAASQQLRVWTERAQVEIFEPEGVTDPSAVAYAACERGQADGFDVVLIDTAGRLHTAANLMEELKKMKRVIAKRVEGAPHEVVVVLDANSGQNALAQAREFHQALSATGVILTKLDGSAKGGIAVSVTCELGLPIRLIGVGEKIDDLRSFSSDDFVDSIL